MHMSACVRVQVRAGAGGHGRMFVEGCADLCASARFERGRWRGQKHGLQGRHVERVCTRVCVRACARACVLMMKQVSKGAFVRNRCVCACVSARTCVVWKSGAKGGLRERRMEGVCVCMCVRGGMLRQSAGIAREGCGGVEL